MTAGEEHLWTRDEVLAYNARIIDEFRANRGRLSEYGATPILLLTTTGARTGARRTSPVSYERMGDAYVVFGSNAGSERHPNWYANVLADPRVVVEVGADTFAAVVRVLSGDERATVLAHHGERLRELEGRTRREFPVLVIEPTGPAPATPI